MLTEGTGRTTLMVTGFEVTDNPSESVATAVRVKLPVGSLLQVIPVEPPVAVPSSVVPW